MQGVFKLAQEQDPWWIKKKQGTGYMCVAF